MGPHDKHGDAKLGEMPCDKEYTEEGIGMHSKGRLTNCFQGFWIHSVRQDGSIALLYTG